jgi:hypothetical protein
MKKVLYFLLVALFSTMAAQLAGLIALDPQRAGQPATPLQPAPPGTSPTSYRSKTDTLYYPEPSPLPRPCSPAPCNIVVQGSSDRLYDNSPYFTSLTYTRVTDAYTGSRVLGDEYVVSDSAEQREWNSTSTGFWIYDYTHPYLIPFRLDPATQTVSRIPCNFLGPDCARRGKQSALLKSQGGWDAAYSIEAAHPHRLYFTDGAMIVGWDYDSTVRNPKERPYYGKVVDFSRDCRSVPRPIQPLHGVSMSGVGGKQTDRRFSAYGGGTQDNGKFVFVYDTQLGCRWLDTSNGTVGGNWKNYHNGEAVVHDESGAVVSKPVWYRTIHNVRSDLDGRWIRIAPQGTTWIDFWDVEGLDIYRCPIGDPGNCIGHMVMGFDGKLVNHSGPNGPPYGMIAKRVLPPADCNPFEPCIAIPNSSMPKGFPRNVDSHLSWNNANKGIDVPVLWCTYQDPSVGQPIVPNLPWEDELMMAATVTDRSDFNYGKVWRIAHLYNRRRGWPAVGLANISPDGRWAIFHSDWGTGRLDVFLVPVR